MNFVDKFYTVSSRFTYNLDFDSNSVWFIFKFYVIGFKINPVNTCRLRNET